VVGWVTAGLTAFYMFRLLFLTFYGTSRVPHDVEHHIHESPATMTVPLMILAALSVVGGWVGIGGRFEHFLDPVIVPMAERPEAASSAGTEYALMAASVLIALVGIWVAWTFYLKRTDIPDRLAKRWSWLYQLVYHKYYVDEIYDAMFVNRAKDLGLALGSFDANVIDGLGVNGAGWLTRFISTLSIWWDTWIVDGSVRLGARIVWLVSYPVRMMQTGLMQSYMLVIVLGLIGFLGYYFYLWKH